MRRENKHENVGRLTANDSTGSRGTSQEGRLTATKGFTLVSDSSLPMLSSKGLNTHAPRHTAGSVMEGSKGDQSLGGTRGNMTIVSGLNLTGTNGSQVKKAYETLGSSGRLERGRPAEAIGIINPRLSDDNQSGASGDSATRKRKMIAMNPIE